MKTVVLAAILSGCAAQPPIYTHWLTDEEDASLRERCEHRACVMVPGDLWETIKKALRAALGVEI